MTETKLNQKTNNMKKLIFALLLLSSTCFGQTTISDGILKASVVGNEKIPVSGSGHPVINGNRLHTYHAARFDSIYVKIAAPRFVLGSDVTGDVYYRNSSGNLVRLGVGSSGQVLTVSGGLPSWATPGGGGFVLTNGRGTTANSTAVDLGGSYTSNVTILNAAGDKNFHVTSGDLGVTAGYGDIFLGADQFQVTSGDIGGTKFNLNMTAVSGLIITDSRSSVSGAKYAADYSSGFISRSLIDKGYATSTFGTLAGNLSQFGSTTSAQLRGVLSDEVGTGAAYFIGGALSTPASVNLSNGTALPPVTGITGWPANSSGVLTNNGSGTLSWTASAAGNPFADNAALVMNNSDNTKLAILSASLISTGTTNTYRLPAASGQVTNTIFTADSHSGNYTLALSDYQAQHEEFFTGSGAMVLTLPDNSGAAIDIGIWLPVRRTGSGTLTFAAGGSATITYTSTQNADLGLNQLMWVHKTGANAWMVENGSVVLTGDISIDVGGVSAYAGTVPASKGGTGVVNNVASTLTFSGNFGTTFTVSAATALTLPVDGTVLALGVSDKTIAAVDKVSTVTYNSLGSNSGFTLSSSSTAAASNTQKVLEVIQTGANGTSAQTTFSGFFTNTKTGTTGINVAVQGMASGGATNRAARFFGPVEFADTEYANPVSETNMLAFFRKDQSSISSVYLINASNTSGARAQFQISNSATVATSLGFASLPASFSTSNILLADAGVVFSDKAAGLNIGTNANTQMSFWTNNTKRIDLSSLGNIIHTNTASASTNTMYTWTQAVMTGGSPVGLLYTGGAHTTLATGAETTDVNFNASATATIAGSTLLALNRTYRFQPRTYTAASATTWTDAATVDIGGAPTGGGAGPLTITNPYALRITGNVALTTAGNKFFIKEGSNGSMGQTTLVSGTKAVTVAGVTTSTRCFVQLVTPSGASLTVERQCVCTANTVTIQANLSATTINAADGSTVNYMLFEPTP